MRSCLLVRLPPLVLPHAKHEATQKAIMSPPSNKRKESGLTVETNHDDKRSRQEESSIVSPEENDRQRVTTPMGGETIRQFFEAQGRTPPKLLAGMQDKDCLVQSAVDKAITLGQDFYQLETEDQIRLSFIVLKKYQQELVKILSAGSPYRPIMEMEGMSTPQAAILASLKLGKAKDTASGNRLARLMHKGGDVVIKECNRSELNACIQTYDEFLKDNPVWASDSSETVFKHGVQPFIRLQEPDSDLCYLIQDSNALNYHLQLRQLRAKGGDQKTSKVVLNNARHIRDILAPDLSCKHVYVGGGSDCVEILRDIVELGTVNVLPREQMLHYVFVYKSTAGEDREEDAAQLYRSLAKGIKIQGGAIFDLPIFNEFEEKGAWKHAGEFSSKTAKGTKHTLLLVGVRKATNEHGKCNGGGYFALFQNTWKNRPIWTEIGFDLLQSMQYPMKSQKVRFYFINHQVNFDKEFDTADDRAAVLAQSSSPAPIEMCNYSTSPMDTDPAVDAASESVAKEDESAADADEDSDRYPQT
jgi:hypothetical protein